VLLGVSSFGITIFKTHAWPGGPLTFGGVAIANARLVGEQARKRTAGTEHEQQMKFVRIKSVADWRKEGRARAGAQEEPAYVRFN